MLKIVCRFEYVFYRFVNNEIHVLGRIIIVDWAIPKDQFLKSQSHEIKEEIKQEETEEIKKEVISDSDEDNENRYH